MVSGSMPGRPYAPSDATDRAGGISAADMSLWLSPGRSDGRSCPLARAAVRLYRARRGPGRFAGAGISTARSPSSARRVSSFAELQDVLSRGRAERLTYRVSDLMHLDGRDLTGLRWPSASEPSSRCEPNCRPTARSGVPAMSRATAQIHCRSRQAASRGDRLQSRQLLPIAPAAATPGGSNLSSARQK